MLNKIKAFLKRETVFAIALIFAIISSFFITPSVKYFDYINWNVLFTLFSLMTVVSGLQSCGLINKCAGFFCKNMKTLRAISVSLVLCCFFFSMFITNDVSLLTFVPFTLLIFNQNVSGQGQENKTCLTNQIDVNKQTAYIIVLETAAANLGSMLTPIGNPQNLFLYNQMKISLFEFCKILLPYSFISLIMLLLMCLAIPNDNICAFQKTNDSAAEKTNRKNLVVYISLFVLCLLSVIKIIPSWILACSILFSVLIFDKKNLFKVDYFLLLTFCAFFIFTGNIGNIQKIKLFLEKAVQNNEFLTGLLTSQIISNVPAALLLEPFAINKNALLLGVNVGGLGTLVASLASLISFKLYSNNGSKTVSSTKYMLIFTIVNIICLIPLCAMYFLITE